MNFSVGTITLIAELVPGSAPAPVAAAQQIGPSAADAHFVVISKLVRRNPPVD